MKSLLLGLLCLLACLTAPAAAADQRPNIVLFLADDLGYGELGCYGNAAAITTHLDRFATQGLKLTDCLSASSVCSPSRSSLLTGRTPFRNGVFTWIPEDSPIHLRTSEVTLLAAAGWPARSAAASDRCTKGATGCRASSAGPARRRRAR